MRPTRRRNNILCLSASVSLQPAGPARAVPAPVPRSHALPRSRWWVEVLAIVWLCWIYDSITELAPLRLHVALAHARELFSLEQALGIAPERSLDHWLAAHHTLALLASDYYDNAHFAVTLGLLGWLWWRRADIYRPLRNTLVLANAIAFVVFWRFPVAPPRMLAGFTDVVASSGAFGSWHTGALATHANQLAAMPSLHMAWALWCTLAVWRMSAGIPVRALAVLHPCLTGAAVLATGNHFVLDIVGGALTLALAAVCVRAAGPLTPRRALAARDRRAAGASVLLGAGASGARALRAACHKVVTKSPTG